MSESGTRLFARYAYPPNALGYCGPEGASVLLRADATAEIAARARAFDGAWAYLEFIAGAAGIADPLDSRVVEAYWIGNDLLDRVRPAELTAFLRHRFAGQAGGTWSSAQERAMAHHSFHVFEVYPWLELLQRTGSPAAVSVLDRCRIRTGVVTAVHGPTATVVSRPLIWAGGALDHGPPSEEVARSLPREVEPGDRVALHWDWICDILTESQQSALERHEQHRIAAVTRGSGAGPRRP
ncbi:DUF6390 family protein [Actinoplanes sp. NPDC024001]|uniref:DUF6390 family protein n=1 Tax=Actinoplanes sp. NPDC024001 TaxID=3154598 RepID=UPI0033C37FB9